jgi:hypothetical protein
MANAAKEALGFERLTVVADAGYSSRAAATACEADGERSTTVCFFANEETFASRTGVGYT